MTGEILVRFDNIQQAWGNLEVIKGSLLELEGLSYRGLGEMEGEAYEGAIAVLDQLESLRLAMVNLCESTKAFMMESGGAYEAAETAIVDKVAGIVVGQVEKLDFNVAEGIVG